MPEERDDAAERAEERKREEYLAYMLALTVAADDFEARIQADWRKVQASVEGYAATARDKMLSAVKGLGLGGEVAPEDDALLAARNEIDSALWEARDKSLARMGIQKASATASTGEGVAVEVNNKLYSIEEGAAVDRVEVAAEEATDAATRSFRKLAEKPMSKADLLELLAGLPLYSQVASGIDNPVRAIEFRTHQQSMVMVDATSGPISEGAVKEAAKKFTPAIGHLEPSYLTHQRAVYRSVMAEYGKALNKTESAATVSYLYYVPSVARGDLAPTGFASAHHGLIRTGKEWESIRRKRDATRPGSFIFTTGFHVNDPGVLLPIGIGMVAVAYEVERQRRQEWLEKQKKRQEEEE